MSKENWNEKEEMEKFYHAIEIAKKITGINKMDELQLSVFEKKVSCGLDILLHDIKTVLLKPEIFSVNEIILTILLAVYLNMLFKYKINQQEAIEIYKTRNKKYKSSFKQSGILGVFVRMHDKLSRLNNLENYEDETIKDSAIDAYNYALMGIIILVENKKIELKNNKKIIN